MSRLYDALKGAGIFRQEKDSQTDGVWESLGVEGAHVLRTVSDPDVSVDTVAADEYGMDTLGAEVAENVRDGLVGNPTKVATDKKSRLLPNAIDPVVAEYYRRLRTKLIQQKAEKGFRRLIVTSASPQEGKTVTVLNLGLSFGMLPSFKVLVVDGDMRKGTLGQWLGVDDGQPGLSNLIDGSAQLEDVVLNADELSMHFITRGNSQVPDLHTSQLQSHFQRMVEHFDLVLVDSPPVNLVADVQLLAASCDAVLLVARAFSTTRKAYERAVEDLLPFRLIGAVLNAGASEGYAYHDYY